MNIYALEGHKVKCSTLNAGYEGEKTKAKKHLEVGKSYTVDYTNVDNWSTDVFLKEFPGIGFNSVFFEDEVEQISDDNMKHPDWSRYNR